MSQCLVSPFGECQKQTRLDHFLSPCIKCGYIKCECPEHSFLAGTSTGCFIDLFAPALLKGSSTPSYLACKSINRTKGECVFSNNVFPAKFPMKKCMGSTCYDARIPQEANAPLFYLIFYFGLTASIGALAFAGMNAMFAHRGEARQKDKAVSTPTQVSTGTRNQHHYTDCHKSRLQDW